MQRVGWHEGDARTYSPGCFWAKARFNSVQCGHPPLSFSKASCACGVAAPALPLPSAYKRGLDFAGRHHLLLLHPSPLYIFSFDFRPSTFGFIFAIFILYLILSYCYLIARIATPRGWQATGLSPYDGGERWCSAAGHGLGTHPLQPSSCSLLTALSRLAINKAHTILITIYFSRHTSRNPKLYASSSTCTMLSPYASIILLPLVTRHSPS